MRISPSSVALLSFLIIFPGGCAVFEKMSLPVPTRYPENTADQRDKPVVPSVPPEEQRPRQAIRTRQDPAQIEARWLAVQDTLRPRSLVRLAEDFVRDFPGSRYVPTARAIIAGARQALKAQRVAGLTSDALEEKGGDASYRDDLKKALRGDKDSAYRIALMYLDGTHGLHKAARRVEQWLRFAAELGNGTASWRVSQIYSRRGQIADAARYERRAVELGYRPPPRLSNRGY
jgi:TPR repeat protein